MSRSILRRPLSVLAASIMIAAPLLAVPVQHAGAEGTKDDKISEQATVDQQLEDIRLELDGVNEDLATTYLALAETELLIPQAQADLEAAQIELAAAQEEDRLIGDRLVAAQDEERRLSGDVEAGQAEIDTGDSEMAEVALSAYKSGAPPNPASVYVGGTSPQDTVDRAVNYRLTMASQGTRLDGLREDQAVTENSADRLTAVREEIDDLKLAAEAAVQRTTDAEAVAAQARTDLDDLYLQQQTQRETLEAKKLEYQGQEATLETRSSTLDAEIQELARQERAREEQAQAAAPAPAPAASTGESGWVPPVDARMNSNFGWRVHPIYGTRRLHAGVDYPVACGVPVGATHSGRVLATTYNNAAGNKLILSHGIHNGKLMTSSYHHLEGFALPVGAQVAAGETVGYVGTTGSSTGCHLHFEIQEDGNSVNPVNYI